MWSPIDDDDDDNDGDDDDDDDDDDDEDDDDGDNDDDGGGGDDDDGGGDDDDDGGGGDGGDDDDDDDDNDDVSALQSRYQLVRMNKNWTEAQRYCQSQYHAQLVSIDNQDEQQALSKYLQSLGGQSAIVCCLF